MYQPTDKYTENESLALMIEVDMELNNVYLDSPVDKLVEKIRERIKGDVWDNTEDLRYEYDPQYVGDLQIEINHFLNNSA